MLNKVLNRAYNAFVTVVSSTGNLWSHRDLRDTDRGSRLTMADSKIFDIAVVGAGPTGLATGLAMASIGLKTVVIAPPANLQDGRTAALFAGSIEFLKRLGVWSHVAEAAAPLRTIRLVDATGHIFRAPEVNFIADEIGIEAFGFNVPNAGLTQALETAARGKLERVVSAGVRSLELGAVNGPAELTTQEGQTFAARLICGADGRQSLCREAADIATRSWSYDQAALVCSFSHSRPHNGVSTEFHRSAGPLTVVPMPGDTSSLVWVERPAEATRISKLSDPDFVVELSKHLGGLLGTIERASQRRVFPLSGLTATKFGQNRVALVGEAAHVMPPIGAQGLNLSLRDAATLAELVGHRHARMEDIGGPAVLEDYENRRRADVSSRVWGIDLMNRSLLAEFLPIHLTRGAGLTALKAFGPLRRWVMAEGISPSYATPTLMLPAPSAL